MRMKVIAYTFFSKRLRIFLIFSLSLFLLPFQSIPSQVAEMTANKLDQTLIVQSLDI